MKHIFQRENSDCGVACLAMILSHLGRDSSYQKISEDIGLTKNGSNIYGICRGAEKNGCDAIGYEGTFDELIQMHKSGELTCPVIARVVNYAGCYHFVIIKKFSKKKILVYDPDKDIGKRYYSYNDFSQIFTGEIIVVEKTEMFVKKKKRLNAFFRFVFTEVNTKSYVKMLFIFLLSAFITGVGLLSSFLLKYITDEVFSNNEFDEKIEMLAVLLTGTAIAYLVKYVLQLVRGKLSLHLAKNLNGDLLNSIYEKLIKLPLSFFEKKNSADLMLRFNDSSKLITAVSSLFLSCSLDIIMCLASGIAICCLSQNLFVISAFIILFNVLVSLLYNKSIRKSRLEVTYRNSELNSCIKETTDGIFTAKSLRGENTLKDNFFTALNEYQNSEIESGKKIISKHSIIELAEAIGILIIFWIGTVDISNDALSIGTLISVYSLLSFFVSPVTNIINFQDELLEAVIAAERLEEITDSSPETNVISDLKIEDGNINFNDVNFSYGYSKPLIKNVSFDIKSGDKLSLIGNSGCGKTTIAKLTAKFITPQNGAVMIDGEDINAYNLDELRRKVCLVPQETFLFNDSYRNNLLYGNNDSLTDEEIYETLSYFGSSFVKEKGLDSIISENGKDLSGGQKQILSLTRALLRKPKILILDEITANIDSESKEKILSTVNNLNNITVIWITHDTDVINSCNYSLRVDECGTIKKLTK